MERRWVRRLGPGIAALGAMAFPLVAPATVAAAPPVRAHVIQRTLVVSGTPFADRITLRASAADRNKVQVDVADDGSADATFDTESYHQFATGYSLRRDAMMWFWDQYANEPAHREQITASPLRATIDQLRGLPPALVITAEADVLRDEGEAYANRLRAAGVRVAAARIQGTIHDFVMLNALANTAATRSAMALAIEWLRIGFGAS